MMLMQHAGVTPDMKKELDEMAKLTPKAAERFKLKEMISRY
jgi:hypothetical protein